MESVVVQVAQVVILVHHLAVGSCFWSRFVFVLISTLCSWGQNMFVFVCYLLIHKLSVVHVLFLELTTCSYQVLIHFVDAPKMMDDFIAAHTFMVAWETTYWSISCVQLRLLTFPLFFNSTSYLDEWKEIRGLNRTIKLFYCAIWV